MLWPRNNRVCRLFYIEEGEGGVRRRELEEEGKEGWGEEGEEGKGRWEEEGDGSLMEGSRGEAVKGDSLKAGVEGRV